LQRCCSVNSTWNKRFSDLLEMAYSPRPESDAVGRCGCVKAIVSAYLQHDTDVSLSTSGLHELYFSNAYKFLARAMSSVQNGMLRYQCKFFFIVDALKIIFHNNVVCFCLQFTNTTNVSKTKHFNTKINRKLFQNKLFRI